MAVTMPKIEITFQQLAATFVSRSERGIAVLILRDATAGSGGSFFRFGLCSGKSGQCLGFRRGCL